MKATLPFLSAVLSLAVTAGAQQPPTPPPSQPAQPPPACQTPQYRQFDFWLGSWTVMNPKELPVGLSEITRAAGGCAIQEKWQATMGGDGSSLSYFDPTDNSWHQLWIGPNGGKVDLKGGLENGAMVMAGDLTTPQGVVKQRIRWTPLPDGGVLHETEISKDGGKTWEKMFAGRYRKR